VSHWWATFYHELAPSQVGFQLFAGAWTLLALGWHVYLRNAPGKLIRWAAVGLDTFCAVVWFAGFVALTAFLGSRVCFGNVCNVARAAAAVSAMQWYVFLVASLPNARLTEQGCSSSPARRRRRSLLCGRSGRPRLCRRSLQLARRFRIA
jgi:hypothetical protein